LLGVFAAILMVLMPSMIYLVFLNTQLVIFTKTISIFFAIFVIIITGVGVEAAI
jgi:hypothetical protein